jgi:hypothetical protein
MVALT